MTCLIRIFHLFIDEKGCRCGERGDHAENCGRPLLVDTPKKRRVIRCKCLESGNACSSKCKCRGCLNGKQNAESSSPKLRQSPISKSNTVYARKRSSDFNELKGSQLAPGPWTELETVLLFVVYGAFRTVSVNVAPEKVCDIYNSYVTEMHARDAQYICKLRVKTVKELKGKIKHMLS